MDTFEGCCALEPNVLMMPCYCEALYETLFCEEPPTRKSRWAREILYRLLTRLMENVFGSLFLSHDFSCFVLCVIGFGLLYLRIIPCKITKPTEFNRVAHIVGWYDLFPSGCGRGHSESYGGCLVPLAEVDAGKGYRAGGNYRSEAQEGGDDGFGEAITVVVVIGGVRQDE